MGGQVRTWSGTSEQVRGTHKLDSTDGWVSQNVEQKGDSQTGSHRWVGKSGCGASKGDSQNGRHRWVGKSGQGASEIVRGTHKLEGTDGWASQDTEQNE